MWVYTRRWVPPENSNIIGLVFLVHGHGEHINRPGYHYLAQQLVEEGYAVFGIDHIGHGRSNGTRGHVSSIEDLSEDFELYVNTISQEYPGIPKLAIGHSMGANILLITVIRNPKLFKAIALSSPGLLHIDPSLSQFTLSLCSATAGIFPKLKAIKLDMNGLSSNRDAVETYLKDPLINKGLLNLCTADSLLKTSRNILPALPNLMIPTYIIHGKQDLIVNYQVSEILYQRLGTPETHKKLYTPERVKHEPWEDPIIDEIITTIKVFFSQYTQNN